MKFIEKVELVSGRLEDSDLTNEKGNLAFVLSLLPIPMLQQASAIAARIENSKHLSERFALVDSKLNELKHGFSKSEEIAKEALEIAKALKGQSETKDVIAKFISQLEKDLAREPSVFQMETSGRSYQELLDSFVETDLAQIEAVDSSQNLLRGTKIRAKRTTLKAESGSVNRIHDTEFAGPGGSVSMSGIKQTGNVDAHGAGLSFGAGGSILFEAPLEANCSVCGQKITVHRAELAGKTHVKCPNVLCGAVLKIV